MVKIKKQKPRPHRKKREAKPMSRRNFKGMLKFIFWTILVAAIGAGVVGFQYMFADSDLFNVKGMDVRFYDEKDVLRRDAFSNIEDKDVLGKNIFLVDLKGFKDRIEDSHPELREVVVRRALPNRLIVQARKRLAVAQIYDNRPYFIDKEGIFLPGMTNTAEEVIPLVFGIRVSPLRSGSPRLNTAQDEGLNKALLLIDAVSQNKRISRYKIKKIDVADSRSISFYLNSADAEKVEIKIGDGEFAKRLDILATVLHQLGQDIGRVKYIDLRFEDPIVGPR